MKLYDYQQHIVDSYDGDAIALFMQVGTGKTITSLACYDVSDCPKLLVVCLASKVVDWTKERPDLNITPLNKGTTKNRKLLAESNRVAISFESTWRLKELLDWVDEDTYIIIDESHKIKNRSSKVSKFMLKLGAKTTHKAILTGTPQVNGYQDYFTQYAFLGLLSPKWSDFKSRYCITSRVDYGNGFPVEEIVGYKRQAELDDIITSVAHYHERKIDDDMLPTEQTISISRPRLYNKVLKDMVYTDKSGETHIFDSIGSRVMVARKMSSGFIGSDIITDEKLNRLRDLLDSTQDKRVVIMYNFNRERDMLVELLKKLDRPFGEYNGRSKDLSGFKNYDNGVALCQYGSASTGINDLVVSHIMIMYSLPLSYIDFEQTKGRIARIGQTHQPMYYYLVMDGTIESNVLKSLKEGRDFDESMWAKMEVGK